VHYFSKTNSIGIRNFFKIQVKYIFAPCGLQILFFIPSVLLFIISDTCAMKKDANGTYVYFSI
jgi:hypothetical protein